MPHIVVKCYPGRTEEQKQKLAERITQDVTELFRSPAESVSVAIVEIPKENWNEQVWDTEIAPQEADGSLYKKPGYTRE